MPLDIVNIPGTKDRADLCLAIMCSMAGKIYIFRLPSPIEMWNKIRILEHEFTEFKDRSWLSKKIFD